MRTIHVETKTMEEMEDIRQTLMKEFDNLIDFDEVWVKQGEDGFYASWPEHPPKDDFSSRVARVSEKYKEKRFTVAYAYHDGLDAISVYEDFKDGKRRT
jgi:hypothetical protein